MVFFKSSIVSVLLFAFAASSVQAQQALEPRCGDCWCIPGNDGTDACPEASDGIVDTFDVSEGLFWSTFTLTNSDADFLTLDEGCYPFAEKGGPVDNFPQSNGPQCTLPEDGVCAYKFTEVETCADRPYEIITYPSQEAAEADGAVMTHVGGCGVCSSAQDFWARIKNYDNLETDSVICATSFAFGSGLDKFNTLAGCFELMGFSEQCSLLWAHSAATSAFRCAGVCIADEVSQQTVLNGPAPACEVEACLSCSNVWQPDFDSLAGRTLYNSGITERIARSCDSFTPIVHDPCVGAQERGPVVTEAPSEVPDDSGSVSKYQALTMTTMIAIIGSSIVLV